MYKPIGTKMKLLLGFSQSWTNTFCKYETRKNKILQPDFKDYFRAVGCIYDDHHSSTMAQSYTPSRHQNWCSASRMSFSAIMNGLPKVCRALHFRNGSSEVRTALHAAAGLRAPIHKRSSVENRARGQQIKSGKGEVFSGSSGPA